MTVDVALIPQYFDRSCLLLEIFRQEYAQFDHFPQQSHLSGRPNLAKAGSDYHS